MTRGLYEEFEDYRAELDRCFFVFDRLVRTDLSRIVFPKTMDEERVAESLISETEFAQPILFSIEYSLARFLQSMGLKPSGMLGHSVSEYVVACLSGVFSFESAVEIVAKRG